MTLLLSAYVLMGSISAEDILKSNDVIAYTCTDGLFLMDVNSGNEIQLKTANAVYNALWDKDGQTLYRTYYNKDYDTYQDDFELYKISLPSMQETKLMANQFDGTLVLNVDITLGAEGNIYVIEKNHGYDEETGKAFFDSTIKSFYNITTGKYERMPANNIKEPDLYQIKTLKPVVTEGYFIKNQIVEEDASSHNELFINKSHKKKGEFTRLTNYGAGKEYMTLHEKPIDFMVSPNDSVIVYSYYYYYNDPGGEYAYTSAVSPDGLNRQFLTTPVGVYNDKNFVWTNDSRLIYSYLLDNDDSGHYLNILGKDWKIKTLKQLFRSNILDIYYRY